jgi:aspartate aminotransferase
LPIDDADRFCAWLLDSFEYDRKTIMVAPASGFYSAPNVGRNEVRLAYVLNKDDLATAMMLLEKALEIYPGRTI